MREIKFRVRDLVGEKWIAPPFSIFWNDAPTVTVCFKEDGFDKALVVGESCDLVQFTGLFDKNGKEICEGDIVTVGDGEVGQVVFDDLPVWDKTLPIDQQREITRVVGFHVVRIPSSKTFEKSNSGRKEAVIVGNVYENPEFLIKK